MNNSSEKFSSTVTSGAPEFNPTTANRHERRKMAKRLGMKRIIGVNKPDKKKI